MASGGVSPLILASLDQNQGADAPARPTQAEGPETIKVWGGLPDGASIIDR
jgi:hypothetical protein